MKKDGGPAFPAVGRLVAPGVFQAYAEGGMTLRDYFAAHAPEMPDWFEFTQGVSTALMVRFIEWRWYYADAMLAQRDK